MLKEPELPLSYCLPLPFSLLLLLSLPFPNPFHGSPECPLPTGASLPGCPGCWQRNRRGRVEGPHEREDLEVPRLRRERMILSALTPEVTRPSAAEAPLLHIW